MTDLGLILTYVLILTAITACLISPIFSLKNKSGGDVKKMAIPIIALIIIVGFSILIASSEVLPHYTNSQGLLISSGTSKIIGGCLITFYILSLIACGAIVYSVFIHKLFNNGKK
jgi:hypothetical protein